MSASLDRLLLETSRESGFSITQTENCDLLLFDVVANRLVRVPSSLALLLTTDMLFVADGDSRTSAAYNWLTLLCAQTDQVNIYAQNFAYTGKLVSQMLSSYGTAGIVPGPTVGGGHQYSPTVTGKRGCYFIWGGTNDLSAGATGAAILANLRAIYALARADGYTTIVGFTETERPIESGWDSSAETQRLALNSGLRALTLGGASTPDILIDTERLFPNRGTSPVFYQNSIHISDLAQRLLAKIVRAQMNGLPDPYLPRIRLWHNNGSQTFPTSATTKMTGFVALEDVANLLTTDYIFCPQTGIVKLNIHFLHGVAASGDVWILQVFSAAGAGSYSEKRRLIYRTDVAGANQTESVTDIFTVTAGDRLDFRITGVSGTGGWSTLASEIMNSFSLQYLSLAPV